jgi:CRP-like cAMP-binding protein
MEIIDILKKTPFVREMEDEELQKLGKMCQSRTFETGESLVRQGKTQEHIYIIEDGLVGIYLELAPMVRRQIQAAASFEVVGFSAMLPPYRARSTAIVIETTKALAFNGKELAGLCINDPKMGCYVHRGLASLVASRLHYAYAQLIGVASQD